MEKPFSAYKGTDPYTFVCYSHKDSTKVYKDITRLDEQGINLWYDEGIPGGTSWRAEIAAALSGAERLLFFISKNSLASAHCLREVRFALDHEVRVLPIYLEDCELTAEFALAFGGVQALYRHVDKLYVTHLEEACRGHQNTAAPLPRSKPGLTARGGLAVTVLVIVTLLGIAWFSIKQETQLTKEQASQTHAVTPYMEGLQLLDRWDKDGHLDGAISKFEESLSIDPDFALALARMAEAQRLKAALSGDESLLDTAIKAAEKAAAINDQLPPVQVALGKIYLAQGQFDLANASLQQALKLDVNDAEVHVGLGNTYKGMGRLEEAETAFRQAIKLNPTKANYYDSYANFLADQERFEEAITQSQAAIAASPDYYPSYVNLGSMLDSLGRLPEAIAMYEQASAIHPTYMGYVNLGHAYTSAGQLGEAEKNTRKAIQMDQSDWLAWGNLGYIQWLQGEEAGSTEAFSKAIELASAARETSPRDPFIYSDLAGYHAKLGQAEEAVRNSEKAIALQPNSGYILAMAAECYETIGQADKARQLLVDALEKGYPVNQVLRNRDLARIYESLPTD